MIQINNISPLPLPVVEYLEKLSSNSKVNRLIVFGSRANSDYEKYSDIDVAVDAPLLEKREWLEFKDEAYYDVRTVLQISLVHLNANPKRLQNQILSTGEVIYDKQAQTN